MFSYITEKCPDINDVAKKSMDAYVQLINYTVSTINQAIEVAIQDNETFVQLEVSNSVEQDVTDYYRYNGYIVDHVDIENENIIRISWKNEIRKILQEEDKDEII